MTKGLVTRVGEWLDRKWEAKATERQLEDVRCELRTRCNTLENAQSKDKIDLRAEIEVLDARISASESVKDFSEMKKRLEQLELYVGMKRVADPTKAPVAKSAFSM